MHGAAGRRRQGDVVRRGTVVAATLGLLAFSAVARPASAVAAEWWEQLPGFGAPNYSSKQRRQQPTAPAGETRKQDESFEDLRSNATPWMSDVMLASIDKAIDLYERIAQRGWRPIQSGRTIRPGDDDERIPAIKARLRATGDLASSQDYYFESLSLSDEVERALRRYQRRNGLRETGRADRQTIAAMNVSARERLEQLRLNRRRITELMQPRVEDRYVLVNVPSFELEAVERYEVKQRHRVIVGRENRETPALKGSIKAINFFPYWRVPTSVATLDLIPRLQKEPQYLNEEGIRIYDGSYDGPEIPQSQIDWHNVDAARIRFKQDPGDRNALGLLRLDMSNEHGVYMHDTPMKNLFGQRGRAFSAGCVRVQGVFDLAQWISEYEPGWEDKSRVRSVIDAGQPLDIQLTRPVPVIFAYITAWAENDGTVQFRPDLYNRDGPAAMAQQGGRDDSDPDAPPPPPSGGITP
ncbi:MAG: L,D-transpeptidase family protein [Hyphomicrobiaceae bacterium]|nr:L,D-transpeptidase family protein [Hyphomicrobiaceae bacterium]